MTQAAPLLVEQAHAHLLLLLLHHLLLLLLALGLRRGGGGGGSGGGGSSGGTTAYGNGKHSVSEPGASVARGGPRCSGGRRCVGGVRSEAKTPRQQKPLAGLHPTASATVLSTFSTPTCKRARESRVPQFGWA